MALNFMNIAPWLDDSERELVDCPICRGTGHGLGDYTHETCPACNGAGVLDSSEVVYAKQHYVGPEYYWGEEAEAV